MEFASLVGPGGALWRAWVAAHWERRLKRHDYLSADVRAIATLVVDRLRTIPLRCVGRLLLGACRLLRWKVQQLEEEAEEVRAGLLAASSGPCLPFVASLPESALTLKLTPGEVSWWGPELEFGAGEQLQLLEEPEVALTEVRASLEEGRRHVAPLETITLGPEAPVQAASASEGPADAFGTPSAEDRAAMELLGRCQAALVDQEEAPPPLDFLLGHSGASASRRGELQLASGDVVSGAGRFLGGDLGRVPLGLPGEAPLMDALEGEEGLASATPRGLVKRLEEEFNTPPFHGDGFPRASTQSSYLARMLEFSPDVPEGPLAPLGPLQPPLEPPGATSGPDDEGPGAAAQAAQTPRKVRRKRFKQWLDEQTEIPKAEYHDTSAITREPLCDYRLFLPHKAPHVGLTTVLADICPLLCEPFLRAPLVGQKRRRALTEAASRPVLAGAPPSAPAAASAAAPGPVVGESADSAPEAAPGAGREGALAGADATAAELGGEPEEGLGLPPLEGLATLPPTPVLEEEEEPEPLVPPWDGGAPTTPRSEGLDGGGAASPFRYPGSPRQSGCEEEDEGLEGAEDLPDAAEASPLPYAPLSPMLDAGEEEEEEDLRLAGLAHAEALAGAETLEDAPMSPAPGDAAGLEPALGAGTELVQPLLGAAGGPAREVPPEDSQRPPKIRRTEEAIVEAVAQASPNIQASHLQGVLGALDAETSLLDLCNASSWGAEDVAQSFMGLLTLHMEGAVSLSQDEPYGDITIGRGPDWPAPELPAADT